MADFCMVRQPVFSRDGDLIGYEIRFRDTPDGRDAFSQSLLTGSLDSLRGDRPAFVPVSRGQFLEQVIQLADPMAVIPLIPNDVGDDASVLEAVERFCAAGGQIAIDQLGETISASDTLLPLAHWVRIDVRSEDAGALAETVARARVRADTLLIADHVYETSQLDLARRLGFDAFEGTHFSRPEPLPSAEVPSATISALRLLGQARDPNVNDRTLEESIAIDPVLTFQLLRIVNSASVGARGVTSIGHALRLIGRNAFLRWLSLAIAASRRSSSGVDEHLVRQAVERARLCEQLAGSGRDAGTLFLVGLFSLLDAVFRVSIDELVSRVALTDEARSALLERRGPYAPALEFAESYELGMFESAGEVAREMGVDPSAIGDIYAGSLLWAEEMLAPMTVAAAPRARHVA